MSVFRLQFDDNMHLCLMSVYGWNVPLEAFPSGVNLQHQTLNAYLREYKPVYTFTVMPRSMFAE